MVDLKSGMTDSQLMEKYSLDFQSLQDIFDKLVQANLATRSYFEKRAVKLAGTRAPEKDKSNACPYCGYSADESFKKCPRCGEDTGEWLNTTELTKILTGSFE